MRGAGRWARLWCGGQAGQGRQTAPAPCGAAATAVQHTRARRAAAQGGHSVQQQSSPSHLTQNTPSANISPRRDERRGVRLQQVSVLVGACFCFLLSQSGDKGTEQKSFELRICTIKLPPIAKECGEWHLPLPSVLLSQTGQEGIGHVHNSHKMPRCPRDCIFLLSPTNIVKGIGKVKSMSSKVCICTP